MYLQKGGPHGPLHGFAGSLGRIDVRSGKRKPLLYSVSSYESILEDNDSKMHVLWEGIWIQKTISVT